MALWLVFDMAWRVGDLERECGIRRLRHGDIVAHNTWHLTLDT